MNGFPQPLLLPTDPRNAIAGVTDPSTGIQIEPTLRQKIIFGLALLWNSRLLVSISPKPLPLPQGHLNALEDTERAVHFQRPARVPLFGWTKKPKSLFIDILMECTCVHVMTSSVSLTAGLSRVPHHRPRF